MDINIRPAESGDLDALLRLYLDYHHELEPFGINCDLNMAQLPRVLEARVRSGLILTDVAEDKSGALCGFIFCSISRLSREFLCQGSETIGLLNDLYVAPSARRVGLAGRFCDRAEAWLRDNGVPVLQLQALIGNAGAQAFWKRRGLTPVSNLQFKTL